MSDFLKGLVATLAGAGQGAMQGIEQQRLQREREAELKRQQEQWNKQFALQTEAAAGQKEDRARDIAKDAYTMAPADADLSTNPLLDEMRKFGFALKDTTPTAAPKVTDSLSLPSMPGSTPYPSLGGAESAPMSAGKYDPNAEGEEAETPVTGEPKPLPVGGPMTFATPTYGLGTPGKTTRAETRQESQARIGRDSEIQMLESLLKGASPDVAPILEASLSALRKGGTPSVSQSEALALVRGSRPAPPPASAQPDFEFQTAFQIANGKKFDDAATPQELAKANAELAKQRIAGTREPRATGGSGGGENLSTRDRVDYQQALTKLSNRPEVKDVREMGRYVGAMEEAMKESMSGGSMIAVDQAVINAFNKLMDPTSVVRESEYARTASDQSLMNRLKGQLGPDGKLAVGGAGLTKQDREAIARMARNFTAAAATKAKDATEEIASMYDQIPTATGVTIGEMLRKGLASPAPAAQAALPPDIEAKVAQAISAGYSRDEAITYLRSKGIIK